MFKDDKQVEEEAPERGSAARLAQPEEKFWKLVKKKKGAKNIHFHQVAEVQVRRRRFPESQSSAAASLDSSFHFFLSSHQLAGASGYELATAVYNLPA